ncbi:MAG: hypothetical protein K0R19_2460, partial [Bacillota bacterium]|nr:hypothetical protein [Bacillota bacterium]
MKEYLSNYSTEIAEKLLKTDFELLEKIIQKLLEAK